MSLAAVIRHALVLLVPLSVVLTSCLYLYPIFQFCAFPSPNATPVPNTAFLSTVQQHLLPESYNAHPIAPFRLLALGDPQLEGDTSLPDSEAASFPNAFAIRDIARSSEKSRKERLQASLHALIDVFFDDIPIFLEWCRKSLDIFGNDYYLAHVYRTVHWWARPSHVTVLGDLIGSQWISDEEFDRRAWRFWNRVFKNGQKVSDDLAGQPASEVEHAHIIGEDPNWKTRIINVAGNHDIGYAGDLNAHRVERFERTYGKVNYELRFQLPLSASSDSPGRAEVPELRVVVLNNMNVDFPATDSKIQGETYDFINNVITTSHDVSEKGHFTMLLTHIPFYKDFGVCVDGPFFDFHDADGEFKGGVKEQNHLSRDISKALLEGIFGMSGNDQVDGNGMGRGGVILVGHDHEGCDTYHYINQSAWALANSVADTPELDIEERLVDETIESEDNDSDQAEDSTHGSWNVSRWDEAQRQSLISRQGIPGIREITVRSMMGDFSGNAGLVSVWFDVQKWEWQFEYASCVLGKPPWWWAIHVLDLVTVAVLLIAFPATLFWERLVAMGCADEAENRSAESSGNGHANSPKRKEAVNGALKHCDTGKDAQSALGSSADREH